jgi:hypothetical protein
MSKSKTQQEWDNQVYELVGDEYTFLEKYRGIGSKVKVVHNTCGYEFEITPKRFLKKQACKMCVAKEVGKRNTHSLEMFKDKIKAVHGDTYEVTGEYKNANTKVEVKHTPCGNVYKVRPDSLSKGSGCKKCLHIRLSKEKMKTTEMFAKEVTDKTNNRYELVSKYEGVHSKVKIKHKECSFIYLVTPFQFIRGRRCPNCNKSKGELLVESVLFDASIDFEKEVEFDDLKDTNKLSFDFFIPLTNTLIEYQGVQHYRPIELFGGEYQFTIQQKHDDLKRAYAKKNDYMLIEIPYTEDSYSKVKSFLSDIL